METIALKLYTRDASGKNACKALRGTGFVPGVIYGHNVTNQLVKVSTKELQLAARRRSSAVMFDVTDGDDTLKGRKLVIKELMREALTGIPMHVDFLEVSETEEIHLEVPVKITGKAKGLEDGGILEIEKRTIDVRALPSNIPDSITVDVSSLMIGQSIHLSEITLPAGVSLNEDGSIPVVALVPPKNESALTKEEQEAQLAASLAEKEKAAKEKK